MNKLNKTLMEQIILCCINCSNRLLNKKLLSTCSVHCDGGGEYKGEKPSSCQSGSSKGNKFTKGLSK